MGSGRSGLYVGATVDTIIDKTATNGQGISIGVPDETNDDDYGSSFSGFCKEINVDKQCKHIPGSKNYEPGKSKLLISLLHAQELINLKSGKGDKINDKKERVDFGEIIGKYIDPSTGEELDTSIGIIHYSKTGTHIVPAKPKGGKQSASE